MRISWLRVAMGIYAAVAAYGHHARAEVVTPPGVHLLNETFAVRQGPALLASHPDLAACEADAQRRTSNAGAAVRSFQMRTGMGALLASPSSLADCRADPQQRLADAGATKVDGSAVLSCSAATRYSSAFQPPTCVATFNYSARYQPGSGQPPACPPAPAARAGECPSGTYGAWLQSASVGADCAITWSPAPTGTCKPVPVCDCEEPPPPTCPAPPAPQTRPGTCPTGTTGSWTQTGTTTYGPAPTCAPTVTWSSAPAGACQPVSTALPAPTGLTGLADTAVGGARLAWNAVTGAGAYDIEKCRGATCTNFESIGCTQSRSRTDALPAGATARYRVQGARAMDCSSGEGAYSATVTVVIAGTSSPGTARLDWTPQGPAAGYYIVYGRTPETLDRQIIVFPPGVNGGTGTSNFVETADDGTMGGRYIVTGLPAGTWHFALKAFSAEYARISELSNIVAKAIQ